MRILKREKVQDIHIALVSKGAVWGILQSGTFFLTYKAEWYKSYSEANEIYEEFIKYN